MHCNDNRTCCRSQYSGRLSTITGRMMRLDAICMNLIALGEAVKGLDKITQGELLPHYSEIYWSGVMKMRDKIAHHYFEMDAEVVFKTLKEDIPTMLPIIQQMIEDISKKK